MSQDLRIDKFWKRVEVRSSVDCWHWKGNPDTWGYGRYKEKIAGKWTSSLAHRCMYQRVYGAQLNPSQKVLHGCDNPICVNPSHLRVGTDAENAMDKVERGRCNPSRKITKEEAISIFFDIRPYKEISSQYGIDETTVSKIKTRQKHSSTTGHIKGSAPKRLRPLPISEAEASRRYRLRKQQKKEMKS